MADGVYLRQVVEQLDVLPDEWVAFLNRVTGEIISLDRGDAGRLEEREEDDDLEDLPDWQREVLLDAQRVFESDDWLMLSSNQEIHGWRIMEDFVDGVENDRARDSLERAILGKGAFRRFKDEVCRMGLDQDWYAFKASSIADFAVRWLEANGIAYSREAPRRE
jgi:hypothetical protein